MLQRIFDYYFKRSTLASPDSALNEFFGAKPSRAGVSVTAESSLKYTTVYACVSLIAETVASLPLIVYRRSGNTKERATSHYLYSLLHDRPNEEMSSFNWREALVSQLLLWGNAYSHVVQDRGGRIKDVYPLLSSEMAVERLDGRIRYRYAGEPVDNILHIPALGFNGVVGKSPIMVAKEAIGLGLAAEEFGAEYFGAGIHPSLNVFLPTGLSTEAQDRLKESFIKRKNRAVMFFEEGMKAERSSIPPEDSQFLETRSFQRSEICAIYRVPPFMVGDVDKQTSWGTGIEQQQIGFVTHTIRPWLVRIEQVLNHTLLSDAERNKGYFVEFLVDGLLRGDLKSRYESYQIGRMAGWLSVNEIRAFENLNPVDGGDEYIVPLNMAPADQLGDIQGGKKEEKSLPESLRAPFERLFEVVAGRLVRKEARFVLRYCQKQDFAERYEEFYRTFSDEVARDFLPVVEAWLEAEGVESPEPLATERCKIIAERHVAESLEQIKKLDTVGDVRAMTDDWERLRVTAIAQIEAKRQEGWIASFAKHGGAQ